MRTAFFHDERTFWHAGGNYAFMAPVGGNVQPMVAGGLPESPESKRRLVNLMRVTGLFDHLEARSAEPATEDDLARVHTRAYLERFGELSRAGGGELGQRTPFGPGGFEIAALSAGLVKAAVMAVARGEVANAYALSRPPGHHCLPDTPMGFCLLANIPVAIEAARRQRLVERVAVIDWDVHHGNGTERIYWEDPDVLAISIHQDDCYPPASGAVADRGGGAGEGATVNVPLPPGCGREAYLHAFDRIVAPAVRGFRPDMIVVASGFDPSGVDPLARMMLTAADFRDMCARAKALAADVAGGRLVLAHEGGYSELHVPFCGHATIEALAGLDLGVEDPLHGRITGQQPKPAVAAFQKRLVDGMAETLGLAG